MVKLLEASNERFSKLTVAVLYNKVEKTKVLIMSSSAPNNLKLVQGASLVRKRDGGRQLASLLAMDLKGCWFNPLSVDLIILFSGDQRY